MAGAVALTGTETQFTTKPSDQGGTVSIQNMTASDSDVAGITTDKSFFVECHQFLSAVAREHGISPRACLPTLIQHFSSMLANPRV